MGAVGLRDTNRNEPAQSRNGDRVVPVLEQTRLETRLLDDYLGISAEVPEDGWDLFGDAQAHEAGSNRLFRPAETRLARRGRLAPRALSRPMPEAKAGCHVNDLQGGDHLAIRHCTQSYDARDARADAWRRVAGPTELRI